MTTKTPLRNADRLRPLGEALDDAAISRMHIRFWLLAGVWAFCSTDSTSSSSVSPIP
ncbi:hypothetical protein ACWDAZ_41965 [Streptomyces sp. NPDC001215]